MGHETQKLLEFDRGEQLSLRSTVDLPPGEKFLLWILDDHLRGQKFWTMTVEQLVKESGYSERAVYNFIKRLKERALIDWEKTFAGSKHLQFSICWQNVADLIEQQAGVGYGVAPRAMPVHEVQRDCTTCNAIESGAVLVHEVQPQRTTCNGIYRNDRPSNDQLNATIIAPAAAETEMVVMVAGCGIGLAGDCIEQALAKGMTAEQIRDVVDHFRKYPGRWSGGVLFERLTRSGAFALPASEGWYGDSAEWKAGQRAGEPPQRATPEIRWGPVLDALNYDDVAALVSRMTPRNRDWVQGRLEGGWDASSQTSREVRRLLLEQLGKEQGTNGIPEKLG